MTGAKNRNTALHLRRKSNAPPATCPQPSPDCHTHSTHPNGVTLQPITLPLHTPCPESRTEGVNRGKNTTLHCLQPALLRTARLPTVYTKPVPSDKVPVPGCREGEGRRMEAAAPTAQHCFNQDLPGDLSHLCASSLHPDWDPNIHVTRPSSCVSVLPRNRIHCWVQAEQMFTQHLQEREPGGAGSQPGGTRLMEIPHGMCTAERVAQNTTLCSSTRPALFIKRLFIGPGLSREQTAKVLRLLPGSESELFGS